MQNANVDELQRFLQPLFLDLDGVSRLDDAERIARIAYQLHPERTRPLELLLAFHLLGHWLEKVGNASRTALNTGISEAELRKTAASIRRLDAPLTDEERAVASAILIDGAGPRGLAEKLARGRREGRTVADTAREALADTHVPDWMSEEAREMLLRRRASRDTFAQAILDESSLVLSA
ncbi:MAG TPA: hypothetical protein VGR95_07775 [Thermoanaerobaculia bacterium]|nr:hypothetical protein [Thermoanaerobaculia bacterium]